MALKYAVKPAVTTGAIEEYNLSFSFKNIIKWNYIKNISDDRVVGTGLG